MLTPSDRPRGGQILLWVSAALFVIFAGLAVCIWHAERDRLDVDPKLLKEVADAESSTPPVISEENEWPQWRGGRRDGVAVVKDLLEDWPADGPPLVWEDKLSGLKKDECFSSFAVKNNKAYNLLREGSDEIVVCWDAGSGKRLWQERYNSELPSGKEFDVYSGGARSTPAVDEGRVYTVGATGILQCRDADNGTLHWQHNLLKQYDAPNLKWGTAFSPLVEGGLVFTNPGGPNGKSLVAFDKKTGKEVWTSQDDPAGYSSPIGITVEGERQIVFFTGKRIVGVAAADGALRWHYPWDTDNGVNAATPIPYVIKVENKERQHLFISSSYNMGCVLLAIVPKEGGGLEARRVFFSKRIRSQFGSPVRVGDFIYGFNVDILVCLSLHTGEVKWSHRGFKMGSLMVVNDYLLVLSETGTLALVKATPESYPGEKASAEVLQGDRCWTMPVVADGKVYLRNKDKVRCLDLRKK